MQALRLCTGRTAHRGSRGIALLFHDHGTRRGWGVNVTPRTTLFTPGKDPVPIVQEAGWTPGPVWTGLAPTGIRSPDRPARSQSLYRLRYLAHRSMEWAFIYQLSYRWTLDHFITPSIFFQLNTNVHSLYFCGIAPSKKMQSKVKKKILYQQWHVKLKHTHEWWFCELKVQCGNK